jgi:hypothetical protein
MLRAAGLLVAVLAGAGTWAALNATALRATFAARNLASATTDDERAKWADTLTGYGEPGVRKLAECVRSGDEPTRAAAAAALDKHLGSLPDNDPRAVACSGAILDVFPDAPEPGKRAVLRLVPAVLKRTGNAHAARCRAVVAEGRVEQSAVMRALRAGMQVAGEEPAGDAGACHGEYAGVVQVAEQVEQQTQGGGLFGAGHGREGRGDGLGPVRQVGGKLLAGVGEGERVAAPVARVGAAVDQLLAPQRAQGM